MSKIDDTNLIDLINSMHGIIDQIKNKSFNFRVDHLKKELEAMTNLINLINLLNEIIDKIENMPRNFRVIHLKKELEDMNNAITMLRNNNPEVYNQVAEHVNTIKRFSSDTSEVVRDRPHEESSLVEIQRAAKKILSILSNTTGGKKKSKKSKKSKNSKRRKSRKSRRRRN